MVMMSSLQFRSLVGAMLCDVFDGVHEKIDPEWDRLFKTETALKRRFEEQTMLTGLGVAQVKPEGKGVTYDQGGEFYRTRFEHLVYALAFALTEELVEDGDHISIGTLYSTHLATALAEAKEIHHATIINRALNVAYPGGDGVPLISGSHPTADGRTWSNRLATPSDLSEAAIEQILTMISTAIDSRGNPIQLKGVRLIVHPINLFTSARLLRSVQRTGTANNDINAINALGLLPQDPQRLTRLTNPKFWAIQTNAPRGLIHKKRRPVRRRMEGDFETGSMRYKADERYSAGWIDARCLYGTEGV